MPNFKEDTSKFQMKNMAYWKAKNAATSPFRKGLFEKIVKKTGQIAQKLIKGDAQV